MSVRYQKKSRLNSSGRDTLQSTSIIQQNNLHYQFINCTHNKIEFHKKLIEAYSLQLTCKCISKNNKNNERQKQNQNDTQYYLQIQGFNLCITKAQVKHNFTMQKYFTQTNQYLRFQAGECQFFVIQNCNIATFKNGLKIMLISDEKRITKNEKISLKIRPTQLIEQNIRLRTSKLGKTLAKNSLNSQSVKKLSLNLNWNQEANNNSHNIIESPTCSDFRHGRQIRKGSMCNLQYDIKGVEYKKSVQKFSRQKQRSYSKSQRKLQIKHIGPVNPLKKVIQTHKLASSKSFKNFNISSQQDKQRKVLETRNLQQQYNEIDISSQSYYTAKKEVQKQFQAPMRIEKKKFNQTSIKENIGFKNTSFTAKSELRPINTLQKSFRQSNTNLKTSIGQHSFGKNISQAKIAQVSRTLITNNNKPIK